MKSAPRARPSVAAGNSANIAASSRRNAPCAFTAAPSLAPSSRRYSPGSPGPGRKGQRRRPKAPTASPCWKRAPARIPLLPAPAAPTKIWGFSGDVPGPLLRVKLGQEIKARLVNRLDQPTALHWRGMRIANEIDGAAGLVQKAVAPGETRDFRFTPPDAGTFFYQPLISAFFRRTARARAPWRGHRG